MVTRRTLWGLTSPWRTPLRCMKLMASAMSRAVSSTQRSMSMEPPQRARVTASASVRVFAPGFAR